MLLSNPIEKKLILIVLAIIAYNFFFINRCLSQQSKLKEIKQAIIEQRKIENYPKILGLSQGEIIASQEINLLPKTRKISQKIMTRIEQGVPALAQKKLIKKTTGTGKYIGVDFSIDENWAMKDHAREIYKLYANLGIKPEDMHFYSSGQLFDEITNRGGFSLVNLNKCIKEISQENAEQIIFSMHAHGGSFVLRKDQNGGWTCVPIIPINKNNPAHNKFVSYAKESEIEFGILRTNNWNRVIKLGQQSSIYRWAREVEKNKWKVGFCVTQYVPDNFFINKAGQLISQLSKYTYYFSWSDSLGEIDNLHQIIGQEGQPWWVPDMDYLNPSPSIIEKAELDIDLNNKKDIPFAFININGDTLLCVDMNINTPYLPSDLTINGIDLNQDGFIGKNGERLDLNNNSLDDEVYIPTIIKMGDNSLLYDLEWQNILSQIPENITLILPFHFCYCGGFANYPPIDKTIFFGSVGVDKYASADVYPLSALAEGTEKDSLDNFLADIDQNGLNWLELFNFAYSNNYYGSKLNSPEGFVFRDNPEFSVSYGPWPNNGQGYFASQTFLADNVTLVKEKEKALPYLFQLFQNYPNPFNPTTTINYKIKKQGRVCLVIFNSLGKKITVLVDEEKRPGKYSIVWDATGMPTGVYLYQIQIGGKIETKKMVLVK